MAVRLTNNTVAEEHAGFARVRLEGWPRMTTEIVAALRDARPRRGRAPQDEVVDCGSACLEPISKLRVIADGL